MNVEFFDKTAEFLPDECFKTPPDLAIVLGSGWGESLACDNVLVEIPYAEIPGLGGTTVKGHAGTFRLYERHGKRIAAFCGRRHWYEGVGFETVVLPIEITRRMGGGCVLLTNASGGINPALRAGDFVIITDHINTVGVNPMIGPAVEGWGPRFPDMTAIYTPVLRETLHECANQLNLRTMDGTYAFTAGPIYETPAEIRAYAHMGADVVGMSTVPEAIFAHACGLQVAGISLVSNMAAGISANPLSHHEVIAAAEEAKPLMAALIDNFLLCDL